MIEGIVSAGVELVKMAADLISSAVHAKDEKAAEILERLKSALVALRGAAVEAKAEIAATDAATDAALAALK